MKQSAVWRVFLLALLLGCSHDEGIKRIKLKGKRVFIAQGNISFILPDTTLIKSQAILFPADTYDGDYGEAACFYHSPDSTTMLSIYVTAIPASNYNPVMPWRVYANEKQAKDVLMKKNREMAVIERFTADSISHAVELDYYLPKRPEIGRRGIPSYAISLTVYGHYRRIKCHFLAPDNVQSRQQLAAIRNSLIVNPAYLVATAKRYPKREYRD